MLLTYGLPVLYFLLTKKISNYCKKNEIILNKEYIRIYNISLSTISLLIVINCSIQSMNYNLSDILCNRYVDNIEIERYTFLFLKIVEWTDTILLIIKNKGVMKKISNIHYYHHAIVPTMTFNGLYQPGEIYVLISNSLAHFFMYLYYAFPKELKNIKFFITLYQHVQHLLAVTLIIYQNINGCKISYPLINILGYVYFFYEYSLLILKNIKTNQKIE